MRLSLSNVVLAATAVSAVSASVLRPRDDDTLARDLTANGMCYYYLLDDRDEDGNRIQDGSKWVEAPSERDNKFSFYPCVEYCKDKDFAMCAPLYLDAITVTEFDAKSPGWKHKTDSEGYPYYQTKCECEVPPELREKIDGFIKEVAEEIAAMWPQMCSMLTATLSNGVDAGVALTPAGFVKNFLKYLIKAVKKLAELLKVSESDSFRKFVLEQCGVEELPEINYNRLTLPRI